MTHYKNLLDPGLFIGPQDFATDKTMLISKVVRESLPERQGEPKTAAPMMYFHYLDKATQKPVELARKYKLPKSVLHGLSIEMGTDIDTWPGNSITLFASKCLSFGEVEECVRVRFKPETDTKIRAWLKKRKSNTSTYMIKES